MISFSVIVVLTNRIFHLFPPHVLKNLLPPISACHYLADWQITSKSAASFRRAVPYKEKDWQRSTTPPKTPLCWWRHNNNKDDLFYGLTKSVCNLPKLQILRAWRAVSSSFHCATVIERESSSRATGLGDHVRALDVGVPDRIFITVHWSLPFCSMTTNEYFFWFEFANFCTNIKHMPHGVLERTKYRNCMNLRYFVP